LICAWSQKHFFFADKLSNVFYSVYVSLMSFPLHFSPPYLLLLQILSVQQLYRICTLYWDGNYNTRSVSPDVSLCVYFPITAKVIAEVVHT